MAEKVFIDRDRCQGHARCWALAPEYFGIDEEGFSYLVDPENTPTDDAKVQRAIRNCPERAIGIRDDGGSA